jgi:biopolymer transport protein ExbB
MNTKVLKIQFFALMALLAGLVADASAQDTGETTGGVTLGQVFQDAGAIGWCIVLLSVIAMGVIIKFFVDLKRDKLAPPDLLDELDALIEEKNYDEALGICEDENNFISNVVLAGLNKVNHPFATIEGAVEEALDEESVKLHMKVGWLSLIAQIAPMMGLLGTVSGMITCFGTIAEKETGVSPKDLAGGIKAALITTLFGLIVAIPVASAFVFFRNRVVMITLEVSALCDELFERFRPAD